MRKLRVGKSTFALTLIALGIILTLRNTYDIDLVWSLKLLAGASIVCLGLEFIWMGSKRKNSEEEIKFRVSILSIILICGLYFVSYIPFEVAIENGHVVTTGLVFLENEDLEVYDYERSYEQDFSSFDTLEVDNSFGKVYVEASNDDKMRVESKIKVTLLEENVELANQTADEAYFISESGDTVTIKKFTPEKDIKIAVDFIIYVPKETLVNIDNSHGEVSVSDVEKANITNRFGPIYVDDITSDVNITNKNGKIEVSTIGGYLNINNSFGDVKASSIEKELNITNKNGKITVDHAMNSSNLTNQFNDIVITDSKGHVEITHKNGDIKVENLDGSLNIDAAFSKIDVNNVTKAVTIENNNGDIITKTLGDELTILSRFSEITASDVVGKVNIDNNNDSVYLENISSDVKITLEYGQVKATSLEGAIEMEVKNTDITINNSEIETKDVDINSKFGDVVINVPENQEGQFDLSVKYGQIQTPFDLTVNEETNSETNKGAIGSGGQHFNVHVSNGDVRFE